MSQLSFSSHFTLRSEYRILQELYPTIPGIVRAIEFRTTSTTEALILEDFGGVSFRLLLGTQGPLYNKLDDFLEMAVQITDTLCT